MKAGFNVNNEVLHKQFMEKFKRSGMSASEFYQMCELLWLTDHEHFRRIFSLELVMSMLDFPRLRMPKRKNDGV